MKKIVLAACVVAGLGLAACGHKTDDTVTNTSTTQVLDNGTTVTSNTTTTAKH